MSNATLTPTPVAGFDSFRFACGCKWTDTGRALPQANAKAEGDRQWHCMSHNPPQLAHFNLTAAMKDEGDFGQEDIDRRTQQRFAREVSDSLPLDYADNA